MSIYLTSDLHLNHDKDFIWQKRGFPSVEQMNITLILNINEIVQPSDHLYILGDIMLGGNEKMSENAQLFNAINCENIHLVRGNHDTDNRWRNYPMWLNHVIEYNNTIYLNYNKYHFYLSHYPTVTTNYEDDKKPWQRLLSVSGHTHSSEKFESCGSYNVAPEAHNNYPVNLDKIVEDFKFYFMPLEKKDKNVFISKNCEKCINYKPPCVGPSDELPYICPSSYSFKRDYYA